MTELGEIGWALRIAARYDIAADITYRTVDGVAVKLDVYRLFGNEAPRPTLMFMHGGGWARGFTKVTWSLWFLPFLHLGWVVVNVDYRPSSVALAPAAVEDCLEALAWIGRNAEQHQIDLKQLVIAGLSSGGHLALLTGMIPSCTPALRPAWAHAAQDAPRPAAIVNWCGVTDTADLLEGPHRREWAVQWLGAQSSALEIARAVSPLTYVSKGLPPLITIHGDRDEIVPYGHATRLHEALVSAQIPNELITLSGAFHASLEAYLNAYPRIFEFLERAGVNVST